MNPLAADIAACRQERNWQMQNARLLRAAGRVEPSRPRLPWLPDLEGLLLSARASAAVHKARVANHELIALRLLATAAPKSVNSPKEIL